MMCARAEDAAEGDGLEICLCSYAIVGFLPEIKEACGREFYSGALQKAKTFMHITYYVA